MFRRLLLVLAALSLFAVACGSSGAPTSYDDTVESSYLEGCRLAFEEAEDQEAIAAGVDAVCGCAYADIVDQVSFERFADLDDRLRNDLSLLRQDPLPQGSAEAIIREIIANCIRTA